jgi:MFS family permease
VPLVGYLSDCFGSTRLIAAGCIVFGASALGLLVSWQRATPITLTVLIAFAGLGSSLFVPANSRRLFAVTPLGAHGTAAGLQAIARNVGMPLGTAAAAAFNQTSLRLHRSDGQPVADVRSTLYRVLSATFIMLLAEMVPFFLFAHDRHAKLSSSPSQLAGTPPASPFDSSTYSRK